MTRATQPRLLTDHEASFWLRGRLADLGTRLQLGELAFCDHPAALVTSGAVHALWSPDRVTCRMCQHDLEPTEPERSICDRCRRHAPTLHTATTRIGAVVVLMGLCHACLDKEVPTS